MPISQADVATNVNYRGCSFDYQELGCATSAAETVRFTTANSR